MKTSTVISTAIIALLFTSALPLSLGAVTTVTKEAQTTAAAKWPDPKRFEKTIVEFERETTHPKNAIVGYGSSSMRGWHKTIQQDLAPLPIIPRGFGGSYISDAIYYLDRVVVPHQPRAILLYEGDNDIAAGIPPSEVAAKYREFVQLVHAKLPQARIYILSTKPSPARWKHWPATRELNSQLKEMASQDPQLKFIDIATPMLKEDGEPRAELFINDKLHMNAEGYALWTKVVRPALMQELQ